MDEATDANLSALSVFNNALHAKGKNACKAMHANTKMHAMREARLRR